MRAEDRKPAKRVFPLLQNLDLDSVTFAQVQSVGEPISIEDMNEQEMLDLIIVNLARLCCAGEWTGLLEAGGEGVGAVIPTANIGTSYTRHVVTHYPLTGSMSAGNSSIAATNSPVSRPFIAPQTGDIDEIGFVVNSGQANTMRIGIYSDSEMAPHELLGYADLDTTSTATVYQTSWSSTVSLVRGTVYHCMFVRTGDGTSPSCVAESNSSLVWIAASSGLSAAPNQQSTLVLSGSDNDLEATVTKTNLAPTYFDPLRISLKYA